MNAFRLEIITPDRIAFGDEIELVEVPSSSGVIGILHGHVPLFARLVEGEVKIKKKNDEFFLAIGGGFVEVTPDKVVVLVTAAYHAEEINEKEVLLAKKRAEEALFAKPTGTALFEARTLFRQSEIALKVLRRRKRYGEKILAS